MFIFLYLKLILFLLLIFLIGKVVTFSLRIKKQPLFFDFFLQLIVGQLFLSLFFSIYKAGFLTIQVIFIPLLFIVYSLVKRKPVFTLDILYHKFLGLFIPFLFVFFLINFSMINNGNWLIPHLDLFVYTDHIKTLIHYGNENNLGYVTNTIFNELGITPYHYFELWLSAFVSVFFKVEPLAAYWAIIYPTFYITVFCGVLAIFEHFNKVRISHFFWSFLFVFIGGVYLPFYHFIPYIEASKYVSGNLISSFGPLYLTWIAFFYSLLTNNKKIAFVIVLFIPILSYSTFPAIVIGALLWLVFDDNLASKKLKIWLFILLFTFAISVFLFYFLFQNEFGSRVNFSDVLPVFIINHSDFTFQEGFIFFLKKLVVYFGLYPLKISIVYVFFILLIYNYADLNKFKYLFFFLISGLISSFLLAIHPESTWLFRNLNIPLLNVLLIVIFVELISKNKLSVIKKASLLILLTYQIYYTFNERYLDINNHQTHSKVYLSRISSFFINESKVLGGIFLTNNYFENAFVKNPKSVLPTKYLSTMPQYCGVINLSVNEIKITDKVGRNKVEKRILENSDLLLFKQKNPLLSNKELVLKSIQMYNLKFIVLEKNYPLPSFLLPLIKSRIIDSDTGEQFCILN